MASESTVSNSEYVNRRWYQMIGPGLITACVVIGPGSILTSSNVGAANGYSLAWIVVVAVFFMSVYMVMGARLGAIAKASPGNLIAERIGRWLAVLIGCGVFFISAAFQFGNNLGVYSAFEVYYPGSWWTVILFNAIALAFLFGFKNLYKAVERLMMCFVALLLISFAINLSVALYKNPNFGELAQGFLPLNVGDIGIEVLGLVGTTFVITAAFFQTYLVRQKGWGKDEVETGIVDARVGSVIMAMITLILMFTAATVLRDAELKSVKDVAVSLETLFGKRGYGQLIFCIGLFSAAYSSFLVNSMIGGFILSDGLGLGSKPSDLWPRLFTALVMITGMVVGLLVIRAKFNPVPAIVAAQAVTVIAAPLVAGALLWLTNREDVMGTDRNGPLLNLFGGIGFLLLLAMAGYTAAVVIPGRIEGYRNPQPAVEATEKENVPVEIDKDKEDVSTESTDDSKVDSSKSSLQEESSQEKVAATRSSP